MNFHDLIYSVIRTGVPTVIGGLISWGVMPEAWGVPAISFGTILVANGYYLICRVLEEKWPKLGWLLGVPHPPTYA